mgnify:CR=1 FL=1
MMIFDAVIADAATSALTREAGAALTPGFAAPEQAEAGSTYYICWVGPKGAECANLPSNYSIKGVRKPKCDARNCNNGTVDFKLTHSRTDRIEKWIKTENMEPGGTATIYAPDR